MKIDILAVGSLKEHYLKEACAEYLKRLSAYAELSVHEIKEEKLPRLASAADEMGVREREGESLLSALSSLPGRSYLIALDIKGKKTDSPGLAKLITEAAEASGGRIAIAIGGSFGLSSKVLDRADTRLSFSDLTFPHQLMRVILLEQIYRAFKIARGEPYHK